MQPQGEHYATEVVNDRVVNETRSAGGGVSSRTTEFVVDQNRSSSLGVSRGMGKKGPRAKEDRKWLGCWGLPEETQCHWKRHGTHGASSMARVRSYHKYRAGKESLYRASV